MLTVPTSNYCPTILLFQPRIFYFSAMSNFLLHCYFCLVAIDGFVPPINPLESFHRLKLNVKFRDLGNFGTKHIHNRKFAIDYNGQTFIGEERSKKSAKKSAALECLRYRFNRNFGNPNERRPQFGYRDERQPKFGHHIERKPEFGHPNERRPEFGYPDERQPAFGHHIERKPEFGHPNERQPDFGNPNERQPEFACPNERQPGMNNSVKFLYDRKAKTEVVFCFENCSNDRDFFLQIL